MPARIQRIMAIAASLAAAVLVAGCSSDGAITTSTVAPTAAAFSAPKVDPACVTLAAQIDTLRKEGKTDRLEKAATGKTTTVPVKRTALAKQAELNKANADFQAKCSTVTPRPTTAQAPVAAPTAATPAVTTAAKVAPVAAAATGSTGAVKDVAVKAATSAAKDAATTAAKDAATQAATNVAQ